MPLNWIEGTCDVSGGNDEQRRNPDQRPKEQQQSPPTACERCGAALGPGTVIGRFGDQPAYAVFVCASCGFIHWRKKSEQ
jgi:hypothetical protein